MLLHILSAGPAAAMTYYIWTEDQQINENHSFYYLHLPLSFPDVSFPSSSLLSLVPQRLLGVFLLNILYAT